MRKRLFQRNVRRYDKAYRRSIEWLARLYTPGTSYFYSYANQYFLLSLYLKGDIDVYKVEPEESIEFPLNLLDDEVEDLLYTHNSWESLLTEHPLANQLKTLKFHKSTLLTEGSTELTSQPLAAMSNRLF